MFEIALKCLKHMGGMLSNLHARHRAPGNDIYLRNKLDPKKKQNTEN